MDALKEFLDIRFDLFIDTISGLAKNIFKMRSSQCLIDFLGVIAEIFVPQAYYAGIDFFEEELIRDGLRPLYNSNSFSPQVNETVLNFLNQTNGINSIDTFDFN